MEINYIKTEIRQVLDAINEQWEQVRDHEGRIPQIELDIIQANIRDLYEAFHQLNRKNEEFYQKGLKVPPVQEAVPEPSVPHVEVTATYVESPVAVTQEEPPPPVAPPVRAAAAGESPAIAARLQPDLFNASPPKNTVSERLVEDKTTLNERLQQEPSNTIGSRLNQNPIKDLKTQIGINEKFLFINQLYNGSMLDYTQAVSELNQQGNYEEALQCIETMKFKYNWDINSDAYHRIMDMVRRRYL